MSYHIPDSVKSLIAERAAYRCEYCRMPQSYAHYRFHYEHIIALQHGGTSHPDNLAYASSICNWKKGPNLSSVLEEDGPLIRLFHPRKDHWPDHFEVVEGVIYSRTDVGAATIKLLEFNHPDILIERRELVRLGLFS